MNCLKYLCTLFAAAVIAAAASVDASAQFKEDPFSQKYNDDKASDQDTSDVMFSFKEYYGGLRHKNELKIGNSFAGSAVFIGGQQIYNKDYWKLPIVYGAIGGGIGAGFYFKGQDKADIAKWCFIGAGAAYWGSLIDGVANYDPAPYPSAGKATIYSILVPGLGQIYNHDYWKLPVYYGCMVAGIHLFSEFSRNYKRYRGIYLDASDSTSGYDGPITATQAQYYKNIYRRYRDYSVLALAAVYLIQIMDANVFAYMHDFEVEDDLSLKVEPAVIMPEFQFASSTPSYGNAAYGLKLGIRF